MKKILLAISALSLSSSVFATSNLILWEGSDKPVPKVAAGGTAPDNAAPDKNVKVFPQKDTITKANK